MKTGKFVKATLRNLKFLKVAFTNYRNPGEARSSATPSPCPNQPMAINREPWGGTAEAVQLPPNHPRLPRATRSRTGCQPEDKPRSLHFTVMSAGVEPRLNTAAT